jgi:hypothetical protein
VIVALALFMAGVTETLAMALATFLFIHVAGAAVVASLTLFVALVAEVATAIIVNAHYAAIAIVSAITVAAQRLGGGSTHAHESDSHDGGESCDNLFHITLSPIWFSTTTDQDQKAVVSSTRFTS